MEVRGVGREVVFTKGSEFLTPYEIAFMGVRKQFPVIIFGIIPKYNKKYLYSFYCIMPHGEKYIFIHQWYDYHGAESQRKEIEREHIKHILKYTLSKVRSEYFEWGIKIGSEQIDKDFYDVFRSVIEEIHIEPSISGFSKLIMKAEVPTKVLRKYLPKLFKEMLSEWGIVRISDKDKNDIREEIYNSTCWKEYEYKGDYRSSIKNIDDLEHIIKRMAMNDRIYINLRHKGLSPLAYHLRDFLCNI